MSSKMGEEGRGAWGMLRRSRSSEPSRSKTAFVLSGGGIQGSIQVGMIKALYERGIKPDVIAATSVGALNGAVIAQSPGDEGLAQLMEIWENLEGEHIFPGSFWSRMVKFVSADHLFPRTGVEKIVDDNVHVERFEDLPTEMHAVACDLETGEEVRFSSGLIRPALLATTALPGAFPPVEHDGRMLIDGGVINNVPVSVVDRPDVTSIYVLNVSAELDEDKEARRPLDVVMKAFAIAKGQRWRFDIEKYATDPRVHVLPRPPFEGLAFDDLTQTRRLFEESYELTKSYLGSVAA